ncbi:MAG TPA: hypothetical protein VN026_03420, partial [Bacteroidia bacterium]|nr:hypothetical protein [Bacteroidia bacterium]
AGSGISISSGSIINTAPNQTVTINGASGIYPNFTVTPGTTYSAGSGISISSGSIINTAPDQTVTINGATGIYPNFTVTPPPATSITPGNSNITVTSVGPNFIISSVPSLSLSGAQLSISNGNTVTLPTGTTYTNGAGISLTSGTIITNTAPNQTVFISGPNVIGSYPNYTVGAGSNPNIIGQGVTTVTTAGNNYTVASPPVNMTYAPVTGVISYSPAIGPNTLNISPSLTFTNAILTVGSNTVFVPGTGLWTKPTATVTSLTNPADNVGIGTAAPSEKLQVETGANSDISIVSTGANRATLNLGTTANHFLGAMSYNGGTNNMDFTSNGIPNRLFFDFSGRTAIGYTTTVSELDVNGSLRLGGSRLFLGGVGGINSGYTGIYENGGDLKLAVFQTGAPANPPFASGGNSIDAMVIKNNTGNVGIGNISPTTHLHISGTNATTVTSAFSSSPETSIRLDNSDLTNNNFSSLVFSTLASNLASFEAAKILGVNSNHTSGSIGGDLVFMTRDPGNIFERMRITSTGSVGIGTSNPSTMLDVVSASSDVANFTSTSATDNRILISNSSGLKGTMGFTTFNNTMQFSSYGNDDLCFGANNLATVIMMLKTSGNVGIGTSAPTAQLEVNQYTKLGSTAPAVQMAKLTGVTGIAQGNTANIVIPAFIAPAKILSVTVMVQWNAVGDWIQPGYTINPGYEFDWYTSGNTLFITNKTANSGNILSKAIQVLITYEQ